MNEGQPVVGAEVKRWENFFRLGDLLAVCDPDTYGNFIDLLRASVEKAAERATDSERSAVAECLQHYRRRASKVDERVGEEVLAIYLTFEGLAVQSAFEDFSNAKNGNCTSKRSAINPVVIPYHDLKSFMLPGPWRTELLKLRTRRKVEAVGKQVKRLMVGPPSLRNEPVSLLPGGITYVAD